MPGYNDREEYIKFIRSVFNDDDFKSLNGGVIDETEEDNEEDDYEPVESNHGPDVDEDEDYDDELAKVAKHEVQDLVDGCLQTLVSKESNDNLSRVVAQGTEYPSGASIDGISLRRNLPPCPETASNASTEIKHGELPCPKLNSSSMSDVVKRLLSSGNVSDICVDGMSVDTVRKLIARQMSMALQLLIQILLMSPQNSLEYAQAYEKVMELSAYREGALKQATLMLQTVKTVTSCRKQMERVLPHLDTEDAATSVGGMSASKPLTRSQIVNRVERTTSVFDLPALGNISRLFESISVRQYRCNAIEENDLMQHRRVHSSDSNNPSTHVITSPTSHMMLNTISQSSSNDFPFERIPGDVQSIFLSSQMRCWRCLIPSNDYPMPSESRALAYQATSTGTLLGRTFFSPAEDDLLLRGVVMYGEDWARIQAALLPSKDMQLLHFRFTQMTTHSAEDDNKFRRFVKLEKEKRSRDNKWAFAEDIQLLRGFEVYGERWALISLFFLPHRQRKELRARWSSLLKDWMKMFAGSSSDLSGHLSGNMMIFLRQIKMEATRKAAELDGEGIDIGAESSDSLVKHDIDANAAQPRITDNDGVLTRSVGITITNNGSNYLHQETPSIDGNYLNLPVMDDDDDVERDSLSDTDSEAEFEHGRYATAADLNELNDLSRPAATDSIIEGTATRNVFPLLGGDLMAEQSICGASCPDRWEMASPLSRGVLATVNQMATSLQRSELLPLESAMLFLRQNGIDNLFDNNNQPTSAIDRRNMCPSPSPNTIANRPHCSPENGSNVPTHHIPAMGLSSVGSHGMTGIAGYNKSSAPLSKQMPATILLDSNAERLPTPLATNIRPTNPTQPLPAPVLSSPNTTWPRSHPYYSKESNLGHGRGITPIRSGHTEVHDYEPITGVNEPVAIANDCELSQDGASILAAFLDTCDRIPQTGSQDSSLSLSSVVSAMITKESSSSGGYLGLKAVAVPSGHTVEGPFLNQAYLSSTSSHIRSSPTANAPVEGMSTSPGANYIAGLSTTSPKVIEDLSAPCEADGDFRLRSERYDQTHGKRKWDAAETTVPRTKQKLDLNLASNIMTSLPNESGESSGLEPMTQDTSAGEIYALASTETDGCTVGAFTRFAMELGSGCQSDYMDDDHSLGPLFLKHGVTTTLSREESLGRSSDIIAKSENKIVNTLQKCPSSSDVPLCDVTTAATSAQPLLLLMSPPRGRPPKAAPLNESSRMSTSSPIKGGLFASVLSGGDLKRPRR